MTHSMDFDTEELEAASHWHGGQSSMLYAIVSTGALSCGTIRPHSHDHDRPMTNAEWFADLVDRLDSEASSAASDAEKRIAALDPDDEDSETEREELEADLDGLQSIVLKCEQFTERAPALLAIDAACAHYASGEYARYTSLGSYTLVYILADGGEMCAACANGHNGSDASVFAEDKSWRIIGSQTYDEGPPLQCAHCNAEIESSYGDPNEGKEVQS